MDPLTYLRVKYAELDEASGRYQTWHLWSRYFVLWAGVATVGLESAHAIPTVRDDVLSVAGAITAGLVGLVTSLMGLVNAPRLWVASRAGAEALKTEAFLYAAGASPYDGSNDDGRLESRILEIELMVAKMSGRGGGA